MANAQKPKLTIEEAQEVTHMARRIAALVLLEDALDVNYRAVAAFNWDASQTPLSTTPVE